MRSWPQRPVVHEVFTWVWLDELARIAGAPITLADVTETQWDRIARPGVDAVWLMGVWERSPYGAAIARTNPAMRAAHEDVLADLDDADVVGSAYCVRDYVVDGRLGGEHGLAVARQALGRRGVRLILDLVPNHVAPDHPWVQQHPEFFITGTSSDLERDPDSFLEIDGTVFACGRDPYFPAWPEVLQLDASHAGLRSAMTELVAELSTRCDGVRCDMAMLALDDVFARTWGERASGGPGPGDGRGFWPTVIGATKALRPDFVFWAEAYWDLESVLLEQGFDACYDKGLYDRLVLESNAGRVREHVADDTERPCNMIRFVENHDEPRAASVLSPEAHRTALAAVLTLPGIALLHEGEPAGRRVRVPVTLGRRPVEELDAALSAFVATLLDAVADGLCRGEWRLAAVHGWPDNNSADRLVAWTWTSDDRRHLIVLNLGDDGADGRVQLPWTDLGGTAVAVDDLLTRTHYERAGDELIDDGLYVALGGHQRHVLCVGSISKVSSDGSVT